MNWKRWIVIMFTFDVCQFLRPPSESHKLHCMKKFGLNYTAKYQYVLYNFLTLLDFNYQVYVWDHEQSELKLMHNKKNVSTKVHLTSA